jgi:hypothetical protein
MKFMNNPIKLDGIKTAKKKKRLEEALKRNILRRKQQSIQRQHAETRLNQSEGDANNDNV